MPHIYISTAATCANLYRCTPLIVGDKFADPDVMRFLGAEISTDYPEPNSQPMYVIFATMRAVLDALQEIGYELITAFAAQGYYTWIMAKSAEGLADHQSSVSTHLSTPDANRGTTSTKSSSKRNTEPSYRSQRSTRLDSKEDRPSMNHKSVETDQEGPKKEDKGVDSIGVERGVNTEEEPKRANTEKKTKGPNPQGEAKGANPDEKVKGNPEGKTKRSESISDKKRRSSKSEPSPESEPEPSPEPEPSHESKPEPEPETEREESIEKN